MRRKRTHEYWDSFVEEIENELNETPNDVTEIAPDEIWRNNEPMIPDLGSYHQFLR